MILKHGMQHWALELYKVCINGDPGLTLTYFMARSNLVTYVFEWGFQSDKNSGCYGNIVSIDL